MVRHLRTSADKVRQYQENLETLVEERTTQLKESNTALKRINQKLTGKLKSAKMRKGPSGKTKMSWTWPCRRR